MDIVRESFVGFPVVRDNAKHPNVYFDVTDFHSPADALQFTAIAQCLLEKGILKDKPDVIVSIADRGCGALTHEVSRLSGVPYTLANWYPDGMPGEIDMGHCAGFNQTGKVWLNGLTAGKRCLILKDRLDDGQTSAALAGACLTAKCTIVGFAFAAELVDLGGVSKISAFNVPTISLLKISLAGAVTVEVGAESVPPQKKPAKRGRDAEPCAPLTEKELTSKLAQISRGFYDVPIITNKELSYPYSFFQLTDFKPIMDAQVVEIMADVCVHLGRFDECDLIVSEADRGGAPLAQAVSRRTGIPFVLANWYPFEDGTGATTSVNIGYSGNGQIVVNGIEKGNRCIFVDDMLSSGGTAEGVLSSVTKLGGIALQGIFVSEKLYPTGKADEAPIRKGKLHLHDCFPQLDVACLVQFVALETKTVPPKASVC